MTKSYLTIIVGIPAKKVLADNPGCIWLRFASSSIMLIQRKRRSTFKHIFAGGNRNSGTFTAKSCNGSFWSKSLHKTGKCSMKGGANKRESEETRTEIQGKSFSFQRLKSTTIRHSSSWHLLSQVKLRLRYASQRTATQCGPPADRKGASSRTWAFQNNWNFRHNKKTLRWKRLSSDNFKSIAAKLEMLHRKDFYSVISRRRISVEDGEHNRKSRFGERPYSKSNQIHKKQAFSVQP